MCLVVLLNPLLGPGDIAIEDFTADLAPRGRRFDVKSPLFPL